MLLEKIVVAQLIYFKFLEAGHYLLRICMWQDFLDLHGHFWSDIPHHMAQEPRVGYDNGAL